MRGLRASEEVPHAWEAAAEGEGRLAGVVEEGRRNCGLGEKKVVEAEEEAVDGEDYSRNTAKKGNTGGEEVARAAGAAEGRRQMIEIALSWKVAERQDRRTAAGCAAGRRNDCRIGRAKPQRCKRCQENPHAEGTGGRRLKQPEGGVEAEEG